VTLTGGLRPRGLPSAARVGSGLALAAASDVAGSTSLEAEKKAGDGCGGDGDDGC